MSEDVRKGSRLSKDVHINTTTKTPLLSKSVVQLFTKGNKRTNKSDTIFQGLVRKLRSINNDRLTCIRQTLSLAHEFLALIDKATPIDYDDVQTSMQLFAANLSMFQSIVQTGNEKLFAYEIFFALLDLLSKPQILSCLANRQSNLTVLHKSYTYLTNLLSTLVANVTPHIPLIKNDIAAQKYSDTFSLMCNRVKYDLQSSAGSTRTTDCLLSMFWNLTDQIIIIDWFLNINFVRNMFECLQAVDLSSAIASQIIGIIYNIARHDRGADELNKCDGFRLLRNIQLRGTSLLNEDNDLTISMAITLLSTSGQIHSDDKRMNKILNQLLQITIKATEVSNSFSIRMKCINRYERFESKDNVFDIFRITSIVKEVFIYRNL